LKNPRRLILVNGKNNNKKRKLLSKRNSNNNKRKFVRRMMEILQLSKILSSTLRVMRNQPRPSLLPLKTPRKRRKKRKPFLSMKFSQFNRLQNLQLHQVVIRMFLVAASVVVADSEEGEEEEEEERSHLDVRRSHKREKLWIFRMIHLSHN